MQPNHSTTLLKFALVADAVASGATGLLMAAGAGLLAGFLVLPEPLMRYAGLFLLPYAAMVAWAGSRPEIPRGLAGLIAAINVVWATGSVALIALGVISPSLIGGLFVTAQAAVVALFAILQIVGLRQSVEGQPA